MAAEHSTGYGINPPFLAGRYCEHDMLFQQINADAVDLLVLGRNERYPLYTTCVATKDLNEFLSVDAAIQTYADILQNGMVYQPLIGELVMAKTENYGWARCHFLGSNGTTIEVYCVDYGVIITVERLAIRVIFYA